MTHFGIHQRFGYYANDLAARIHHRICNDTHQSDSTAAINQGDLLIGECLAEQARRIRIDRCVATRRTAINAEGTKFVFHEFKALTVCARS